MRRSLLVTMLPAGLALALLAGAGCAGPASRAPGPAAVPATTSSLPPPATSPPPTPTAVAPAPMTATTGGTTSSITSATDGGGQPRGSPCGSTAAPPATYHHVLWIWMENHTWPQVLGDPTAAPYAVSVARQCGTATRYAAVGSPSLPNYLAATSGATQGITDDAPPASHPLAVDNLFRQVRAAGGTERTYAEDMASPCQLSSAGGYAVKHNPAAYYAGANDRGACQADDVPFTGFGADLRAGHLPTFAFVVPNGCHSTHDCGVTSGDTWLSGFLPQVLASPSYRSGDTAVFVVWDEYTPIPDLVIAPTVSPATVVAAAVNHYALLRTTEEMLGLVDHLGAANAAPSLRGPFRM